MAEPRTRIGQTVVKTLFGMSGNQCYFPGCEEKMGLPQWKKCNGEIAHIHGERRGAPRYDHALSVKARNSHANLMLLCPKHHKLIDQLEPDAYPPEELRQIKAEHEQRMEYAWNWASDAELDYYATVLLAPVYEPIETARTHDVTLETEQVQVPSLDSAPNAESTERGAAERTGRTYDIALRPSQRSRVAERAGWTHRASRRGSGTRAAAVDPPGVSRCIREARYSGSRDRQHGG